MLSALAILTLTFWLAARHRQRSSSAIFGGVLLAGAACSFSIGIVILPLTLIGILFVIGLLGLVPFFTAFVYLRNALRAIRPGGAPLRCVSHTAAVVLSAVLSFGLSAFAQWKVTDIANQSMGQVLSGDRGSDETAIHRIKRFRWVVDTDKIVREYESETDVGRRERLGKAYKEITGEEIQARLRRLRD